MPHSLIVPPAPKAIVPSELAYANIYERAFIMGEILPPSHHHRATPA